MKVFSTFGNNQVQGHPHPTPPHSTPVDVEVTSEPGFLGVILVPSQDTEVVANAGIENEAISSVKIDSKIIVLRGKAQEGGQLAWMDSALSCELFP